jgi:hypothetical protein
MFLNLNTVKTDITSAAIRAKKTRVTFLFDFIFDRPKRAALIPPST